MFKAAKKYKTTCSSKSTRSVIFDRVYEAITRDEAEARAYLNCVKEYNNASDIIVSVKRITPVKEIL
jgi:hypothetical protein